MMWEQVLEGEDKKRAVDEVIMARHEETKHFTYNESALPRTAVLKLTVTEISAKANLDTERFVHIGEQGVEGNRAQYRIGQAEVADKGSPGATLGFVRRALVAKQQEMGKAKGIVMDGRDIGTVVFPDAELKLFVTASPEVRAKRRVDELEAKGIPASYEEVLENVKKRDYIDSTREESPLRQADDALVLDNSHMTLDEQKAWLLEQYHKAIGS